MLSFAVLKLFTWQMTLLILLALVVLIVLVTVEGTAKIKWEVVLALVYKKEKKGEKEKHFD